MSTLNETTEETPSSKRRRIALACQACRQRKLKCDRSYPYCGRCKERNRPDRCLYDPGALLEMTPQEQAPRILGSANDNITQNATSSVSHTSVAAAHERDQRTEEMQTQITTLQRKISSLEHQLNFAMPDTRSRSAHQGANDISNGTEGTQLGHSEFKQFKGKSFKTSYYGPSHPTSQLGQVMTPCQ